MRAVVDCLPYQTKLAMLDGIERFEIIAGAYSSRDGGVCPMLAAHRCGGRTDYRSFARAWDRFTGAGKARRANERELRTLRAQLERSVWNEEMTRMELSRVEPSPTKPRPKPTTDVTGDGMRGAWLMPFRDLDGYRRALEAALRQLDELEKAADSMTNDAREAERLTV
jgi:hypothetical protein